MRGACRLLVRAFAADPVIGHFLRDGWRKRLAFPALFRSTLEYALPSGHVYGAYDNGRVCAIAIWFPPEMRGPDSNGARRAERAMLVPRLLFPRKSRELIAGFGRLGRHHPRAPHWYLAFVGVDPTAQSRGIGTQLLAPVLQLADRSQQLCYLETPFARTHAFYRRLGFELAEELHVSDSAPPVWSFVRQPVVA